MKKILLTGANGLLGQSVVRLLRDKFKILASDLSDTYFDEALPPSMYIPADITDRVQIKRIVEDYVPDIVINAAAYTDVDKSEKDKDNCWKVNVKAVEQMIEAAQTCNPVFVHISTDYVFDGNAAPYRETDDYKPLGFYGHSKVASEKVVRGSGLEYIIIRSQVLYGTGIKVRPNFVSWVISELKRGKTIRVVNDQIGNPTFIDDLSVAIAKLLELEEYGIFHVAGNEPISRYDFALKIGKVFELPAENIQEVTTGELGQKAERPMNSTFILNKLSNTIDWLPGDTESGLSRLKEQLQQHGG